MHSLYRNSINLPATSGSKSALSAVAAAFDTLGKGITPLFPTFESTSGRENLLTTRIESPTIKTLNRTPPTREPELMEVKQQESRTWKKMGPNASKTYHDLQTPVVPRVGGAL